MGTEMGSGGVVGAELRGGVGVSFTSPFYQREEWVIPLRNGANFPRRGVYGGIELKRTANHCNVVTLRDLPVPGFPEPNPPISFFVHVQFGCIQTF
jgi:hypothetical protein